MTRNRNDLVHICQDYYRKPNDDVFEYCKCGARYFLNRFTYKTMQDLTKL